LLLLAATIFTLVPARADETAIRAAPAASLIQYDIPGGDGVFALSLRAGSLPAAGEHDYAILFDTSASQAGAHRRQGLAVLDACLKQFNKTDRVRLFAVDLRTRPLDDGFHSVQSEEVRGAVENLQRIVPLGATDLKQALESGLKSFSGDRARSIVYIGDGMSSARLVQIPELRKLVSELREARVPAISFAVGPRTDLQLLGTIACHTGGAVLVDALIDDSKTTPEAVGKALAAAAAAPVFYPEQISLSPEVEKLLPALPPIRADRDTILLGRDRVTEALNVTASGDGRKLEWTVKPAARQSGNTFLVRLWEMAEQTDGLAIAVAGQELLETARQEFEEQIMQLVAEGARAVAVRDLKLAEQIAQTIRQFDPENVEAETIMNAVQKAKAAAAALSRREKDGKAVRNNDNLGDQDSKGTPAASRASKLRKSVLLSIELARQDAESDRQGALKSLERIRTTVESSSGLDPAVRDDLLGKVKAAVDEIKGKK
jgi:hypothetical protein